MLQSVVGRRSVARDRIAGGGAPHRRARRWSVEALEERLLLTGSETRTPPVPLTLSAELSPKSDLAGSGMVLGSTTVIVGRTARGAKVRLEQTLRGAIHRVTTAGPHGEYRFSLRLPPGRASFRVAAATTVGRTAVADLNLVRCDVLVDWNITALNAVRTAGSNPPMVARNLAMVQVAVFDAVNSIEHRYQPFGGIQVRAHRGASGAAAVAGAADRVLRALYPEQAASFDATLAATLATVPNRRARDEGLTVGRLVGDAVIALRANDGSAKSLPAPLATQPGMWSPTPPKFGPAVGLNFASVTPWAMTSPSQFRPGPPPALDSVQYAAAYNEVKSLGAVNSTARTPDQTAYAHFWADLPSATFTPPGHWNQIAEDAAMARRLGLLSEARLFAMLDIALADAGISCWETKNFYDFWRPVTAIRAGDSDGNLLTIGDPAWTPLWASPAFSSYTSGHATFSAAASTVLNSFFGPSFAFTDAGDPTQHLPARQFAGFDQAANEAASSRLYGGIHFRFDNETGLAVGRQLGQYVLQHELLPVPRS